MTSFIHQVNMKRDLLGGAMLSLYSILCVGKLELSHIGLQVVFFVI